MGGGGGGLLKDGCTCKHMVGCWFSLTKEMMLLVTVCHGCHGIL